MQDKKQALFNYINDVENEMLDITNQIKGCDSSAEIEYLKGLRREFLESCRTLQDVLAILGWSDDYTDYKFNK